MTEQTGFSGEASLEQANARIARLEEQVATLHRQLTARAESLPSIVPKLYREEEIPDLSARGEAPVDLVLTVRNTFDFLVPCLESVFANTDVPFRLFLNDNASTDPKTPEYLRQIQARHPDQVRLFLQDRDLGFPDAVNLMLAETTNDVILVNADTVLPPGWASRLLWPIRHSGVKAASAAPFTNSTAMACFPYAKRDNELLPGLDTTATDKIFRHVKPTVEWRFPWSPGFCMALSREAIREVGLLDAETFRPAYSEEADWCCRATKFGYAHLLAANLFVYHKHGITFKRELSAGRDKLLAEHAAILEKRHPGTFDKVYAFNDNPEFLSLCAFLLFLAGSESGGGTEVHFVSLDTCRKLSDDTAHPVLFAARDADTGEYFLRFFYHGYRAAFTSPNLDWVLKAMYRVAVTGVLIECFPPGDEERAKQSLLRVGKHFGVAVRGKDGNEIHGA